MRGSSVQWVTSCVSGEFSEVRDILHCIGFLPPKDPSVREGLLQGKDESSGTWSVNLADSERRRMSNLQRWAASLSVPKEGPSIRY